MYALTNHFRRSAVIVLVIAVALLLASVTGCRKEDMAEQARAGTHEPSSFFDDKNSARPLPQGTVSRENVVARAVAGGPSDAYEFDRSLLALTDFPPDFPSSGAALERRLERGRERYNIYCAVCHGETGAGDGMIVQRGFTRPPAFYPIAPEEKTNADLYRRENNLLTVPPGYIFEKITNGYGAMYPYASRVKPDDRWNITAYVLALQMSRHTSVADLSDDDRAAMASKVRPQ